VRGVRLPAQGRHFFTWDPVLHVAPNRTWRRWGTDDLVRRLLRIVEDYARAHPGAPRVGIGDLSRPGGGPFGPKHATHQNGLDADVYYPRLDRRERPPKRAEQMNRRLSQALLDLFVAAGADVIYIGPNTRLTGPPHVVQVLWNHDNHLHVRLHDPDK
jgi:murein endopeptidase